MHYGQTLQSHALHFFHLSSPDLLFGFDSAVAQRNIVGVAQANPEVAKKGILLRKFGQEVIRITAGKRVHGTGAVPGGVNKLVTAQERDMLKQDLPQMLSWAQEAVDLVKQLHAQSPALYKSFGNFRSNLLSIVRTDGAMDLYDGVLRVRDANGAILFDGVNDQDYIDLIEEEVRSWSYMKFPHLRSLGRELGWYRVGPLARVQNCDFIPSPRAELERQTFVAWGQGSIVHASLAYHWARMIEMLHAVEVIAELLDDPALLSGDLLMPGTRSQSRTGVGIIEAPRGTLIHDYDVGDDDLVTRCNLIVSTTHNNQAMNEAVRSVARDYLSGHDITEGLLNHIEVAIRAYDPCLSCATHALGQMPLDVSLVSADGRVLDRVQKSADGGLTRSFSEDI
jgi:NAD-reducing hydrogenase large subunit